MIGHYLLTLTPEQEDRVLTYRFHGAYEWQPEMGRSACLVSVAENMDYIAALTYRRWGNYAPGYAYEDLCKRFGTERVNAAIRNRILSNRACRALTSEPAHECV